MTGRPLSIDGHGRPCESEGEFQGQGGELPCFGLEKVELGVHGGHGEDFAAARAWPGACM